MMRKRVQLVRARSRHRHGVTLVLTLLLMAVLSLSLARQTLRAGTARTAGLTESFSLESRWVAEGLAEQWLARAVDPAVDWDELSGAHRWKLGAIEIDLQASAAENKVCVRTVEAEHWLAAWRRRRPESAVPNVMFAEDLRRSLIDSGHAAIECVLDSDRHVSDKDAYVSTNPGGAPADFLTVWGSAKVDLNRAPRDVMQTTLTGFTDAQIASILRLREREPLYSLQVLSLKLGLSRAQSQVLDQVGVFAPENLEMLIVVRRGRLSATYHAVLDVKAERVAEVRLLQ